MMMGNTIKILHLEDAPSDAKLIWNVLKKTNPEYQRLVVETKDQFTAALADYAPDIILSDHTLPSFNSHEALDILHATGQKIPFILITSTMSEDFAVDAIRRGADDYILKDRLERLPTAIHNILERFRLEKERRFYLDEVINNEKRYRSLIENISDAIILINEHSAVLYQSPSVERLLGFTTSDLKDSMFIDSIHPDDRRDYSLILDWANAQPAVSLPAQYRVVTREGHYIWTEGTITNLLHDTSVKAFVLNYRDVTQSRRAEEKIGHANRLYSVLSQINKAIVHVTGEQSLLDLACKIAVMEGKFIMAWVGIPDPANKKLRLVASCGASPRDLQVLADYTYLPQGLVDRTLQNGRYHVINDIQHEIKAQSTKYLRDSGFNSGICLALKKSGRISYILTIFSTEVNFFDPEEISLLEEATNDLSFAIEVFEKDRLRKLAEEKLKTNELEKKKLEALLIKSNTLARIGNWELDMLKNTLYWSEITRVIHETEPSFIPDIGTAIDFYKPGAATRAITLAIGEAIEKGTSFDLELQITTARSNERWVRCIGEAEFVDGICIRLYGSIQDIDARKKTEVEMLAVSEEKNSILLAIVKERKLSEARLAISNAELERFAYVASHDLQEPLRMVTGFLTQIETKYDSLLDDKGKQYIHFAVDGARRMRQIIVDLLEFSRIGLNRDNKEEINLKLLITEIVALYSKTIEETRAQVLFQDLTVIKAFRVPLFQIFQNLIGNALKYQKGDIPPAITIRSEETADHWQYSVQDNGIGIQPEYFEKIFILFQRLHNKDEYSGTGMGLAICKKLVENMGGSIWLHSEEGRGSNFFFTIPKEL